MVTLWRIWNNENSLRVLVSYRDMIQKSEKIMGTDIEILIPKHQNNFSDAKTEEEIEKAFQVFRDLEARFSRFLPDSELSLLNTQKKMVVSDEFLKVLQFSLSLAHQTNGVFNPLVSLSPLGYSADFSQKKFKKISPQKKFSSSSLFSKIQSVFVFFSRFFPEKNNTLQDMKNFLDFTALKIHKKNRK